MRTSSSSRDSPFFLSDESTPGLERDDEFVLTPVDQSEVQISFTYTGNPVVNRETAVLRANVRTGSGN